MTDASERPTGSAWQPYVPPVRWLAEYQAKWLPQDAIAGVTLAAYAIPVSLAYATLAGLPLCWKTCPRRCSPPWC